MANNFHSIIAIRQIGTHYLPLGFGRPDLNLTAIERIQTGVRIETATSAPRKLGIVMAQQLRITGFQGQGKSKLPERLVDRRLIPLMRLRMGVGSGIVQAQI